MPEIEDPGEVVKVVAAVAAVLIALYQLWAVRRSVKADHDRRKKQATLDFYVKVMDEALEHRRRLTETYGMERIPDEEIRRLRNASRDGGSAVEGERDYLSLHYDLKSVLNGLERIAAGVRIDVFDAETAKLIGKSNITGSVRRFGRYVEVTQQDAKKSNYENLMWFNQQLEDADAEPEPKKVKKP